MFGGKPVWKKKIPLQPIASLKSIFVSSRIHSSLFWLVILLALLFHSLVFSTLTAISSVNQKNWSAVLYGPHFYRFHAIRKTYLTKMLPWHETKASNTLKKTTKHLIYIYYIYIDIYIYTIYSICIPHKKIAKNSIASHSSTFSFSCTKKRSHHWHGCRLFWHLLGPGRSNQGSKIRVHHPPPSRDPAGTTRCVVSFHHHVTTKKNTSSIHKSMPLVFLQWFLTGGLSEIWWKSNGENCHRNLLWKWMCVCCFLFGSSPHPWCTWQCSKQTIAQKQIVKAEFHGVIFWRIPSIPTKLLLM